MTISANVGGGYQAYFALLSDGRQLVESDLAALAAALNRASVPASKVRHEWHEGWRMLTAGQQVSLHASLRDMERYAFEPRREAAGVAGFQGW